MTTTPHSLARIGLAGLLGLALAPAIFAVDRNWTDLGADSHWSTPGNWDTAVPGTGDKAIFNSPATPVNLDSNRTISGLVLGGTGFDLQSAGGFTLTSNIVSGGYSIVGNAAGTNTISHSLSTGAIVGSRNWLQLSNGSNLILGAASTMTFNPTGTSTALRNVTFDVGANSTLTSNGTLTLDNQSSSTDIRFNKTGAGTIQLNSANTMAGFSRIALGGGTFAVGVSDALGSVDIVSVNGANVAKAVLLTSADVTLTNKIQFLEGGATSTHTIGGTNTSGTVTFDSGSNALDLSKGGTTAGLEATRFTATAGGTVVFKSTIQNNNSSSANRRGSVDKIGSGTVIFEGANTYSEGTTVSEGKLLFNNATGSGAGTGDVTLLAGATLGGNGGFSGTLFTQGLSSIISPGGGEGYTGNTLTLGGLDASLGAMIDFALGHDQIAITGVFTGGDLLFDFSSTTAPLSYNSAYTLLTFGSMTPDSFTLGDVSFQGLTLGDGVYGEFSLNANNLQFTVIPEPGTYALIFGGLAMVGAMWVRRRKA